MTIQSSPNHAFELTLFSVLPLLVVVAMSCCNASTLLDWSHGPISLNPLQEPGPYFGLSVSPAAASVKPGSTVNIGIVITSLNGLSFSTPCNGAWWGHIDLVVTISPSVTSGPVANVTPSCMTISSGGTGRATLQASASPLTNPGVYTMHVKASFQVSPSGWSSGEETSVLLSVVQNAYTNPIYSALIVGAIAAGTIIPIAVMRVRSRNASGDCEGDSSSKTPLLYPVAFLKHQLSPVRLAEIIALTKSSDETPRPRAFVSRKNLSIRSFSSPSSIRTSSSIFSSFGRLSSGIRKKSPDIFTDSILPSLSLSRTRTIFPPVAL